MIKKFLKSFFFNENYCFFCKENIIKNESSLGMTEDEKTDLLLILVLLILLIIFLKYFLHLL